MMRATEMQRIGRTVGESEEQWPDPEPSAHPDGPNVIVILLDDVGFAHYGCFGSRIATPNIDRLAKEGLSFNNFHTTAMCSPTRASLLTGRNPHSVGFGHVTERLAGYPGYSMRLPESAATLAEMLRMNGYSTWALGKWHLTPSYETGPQGPFERWPLAKGFQRFYGFLGGSTDQFSPELVRDNSPTVPPRTPAQGYHLSEDLADEAIRQIRDLKSVAPHRPFFLYLAPGACHAPHQAPSEWVERFRGHFDEGWDVERDLILARQIERGVMPEGTELGPLNPGVQAWDACSADEKRLYARMMEAFAGFLSYTDAQIGRLLDHLDDIGITDNTIVLLMSDNGASAEGGPEGSVDESLQVNDRPQRAVDALEHIDQLGGPKLYNHYPWGWAQAGNTPFRWYKQFTHAGGNTNGLIVRFPGGGVPAGEIRQQYHHVIDVLPTVMELLDLEVPTEVRGVAQQSIHGVSMAYAFADAEADSRRFSQHYEMWGNRGMWRDGWMAVCRLHPDAAGAHPPAAITVPFDELHWELYHHPTDPSERNDLSGEEPAKLRELTEHWWAAAGRYQVLPVDNRQRAKRWPAHPPLPAGAERDRTVFLGAGGPFERGVAPKLGGRSFRLVADFTTTTDSAEGVLYTVGGAHGGYCLYLKDGSVHFEVAQSSVVTETVSAPLRTEAGRHELSVDMFMLSDARGRVVLSLDERRLGAGTVSTLLKRVPVGVGRTYIGYAASSTVSNAFAVPFPFRGVLHRVTVILRDQIDVPVGEELAAEMRDQ